MIKKITVFTPAYNRAYTLPHLYASLLRQNNKDFEWLVIDDGSTDSTAELVKGWEKENKIPIRYIRQKNKGMLGAHNTAYDHIDSELNVCIDSDDYMPDNAIETILKMWEKCKSPDIAGLIGLDIDKKGAIIGKKFETSNKRIEYESLLTIRGLGDKKFVLRTEVVNKYDRYPEYEKEKFPAAAWLYRIIGQDYKYITLNEPLCIVEYLPDGNSKNKFKQYLNNPNAFADYRIECMKMDQSFKDRFRNAIHYVSSKLIAKKKIIDGRTPHKSTVFLAIPFGIALKIYLQNTKRRGVK